MFYFIMLKSITFANHLKIMKAKGYFLAILSAVSYGLIPLFAIPLKTQPIAFDTVLFYRFFLGAAMIGLYLVIKRADLRISGKELLLMILLGLMFALSSTFLFMGYDYLSAGVASTILFTYPVFVALIMAVFFKEKISLKTGLAIILALGGVAVLSMEEDSIEINILGLIIVLLSALFYALYIVIVNVSSAKNLSGTKVTFYSMFFCSLFFLVKSLMQANSLAIPSLSSAGIVFSFSLVTTVISCITLVYAIKYIGATPTSILGALEPVVAVCVSVVLFHEPFTYNLILGIILIIAAVLLNILPVKLPQK